MAQRTGIVGRDDAADGRRVEGAVDRKPLAVPRELAIELRERDAGVRRGRQIAVPMDEQRVQLRRADDQIDRRGRAAPAELRAAAAE